jgi:nucleotide-binding universal stress UspA family protein
VKDHTTINDLADREGSIVVGVDGSASSGQALRWAASQALATGAVLRIVTAWHVPNLSYGGLVPVFPDYDFAGAARVVQAEQISDVLGVAPLLEYTSAIVGGPAGPELVAASEGADMLVVGSRGHGALAGAILGSVSEYCATHATGAVVVVHPGQSSTRPLAASAVGAASE